MWFAMFCSLLSGAEEEEEEEDVDVEEVDAEAEVEGVEVVRFLASNGMTVFSGSFLPLNKGAALRSFLSRDDKRIWAAAELRMPQCPVVQVPLQLVVIFNSLAPTGSSSSQQSTNAPQVRWETASANRPGTKMNDVPRFFRGKWLVRLCGYVR